VDLADPLASSPYHDVINAWDLQLESSQDSLIEILVNQKAKLGMNDYALMSCVLARTRARKPSVS
jgi:hypothetical protein